nr:MAG TPA: hypothetical protein [Caudoviricetes sp.]
MYHKKNFIDWKKVFDFYVKLVHLAQIFSYDFLN